MSEDEQAIREVQSAWFDATANGDLARLRTLMTDDVVFLTPGRPPLGRDAFAAQFSAGRLQVRLSCSGEMEELVVVHDVAYARSRLAVTATPIAGGEPMRLEGYALTIFRRYPDGRWALARDASLMAQVKE